MKRLLIATTVLGLLTSMLLSPVSNDLASALSSVANDLQAHPFVVNQTTPASTTDMTVVASAYHYPSQNATLAQYAHELGINTTAVTLKYMDSATPPANSDLPTSDQAIGMFDPNTNTIYVLNKESTFEGGTEAADETQTVAYEYMHYVWTHDLDSSEQASEGQALANYDQQNSYFHSLVDEYTGNQNTLDNEYAATACTEIQPNQLSSSFNNWCNRYIPNRETVLF